MNLVKNWVNLVKTEGTIKKGLEDLNAECGTTYTHSELSRLVHGRRRMPPVVINYMLAMVLISLDQKSLIEQIRLPEQDFGQKTRKPNKMPYICDIRA